MLFTLCNKLGHFENRCQAPNFLIQPDDHVHDNQLEEDNELALEFENEVVDLPDFDRLSEASENSDEDFSDHD